MDGLEPGQEPIFEDVLGTSSAILVRHLADLQQNPELPETHYAVGIEYRHLERLDAARHHLQHAVRLKPDYAIAHSALGDVLLLSGLLERAKDHAGIACRLAPDRPDFAVALASVLDAARESQQAWEIVDGLLRAGCQTTRLTLLHAQMAPQRKRELAALDGIADLLRSANPLPAREQSALHFAAANLLDKLGRHDDAFGHAVHANQLRDVTYDASLVERLVGQFMEYFSRSRLGRLPRAGGRQETPVFIVGMPRSGTSLVEQILASHPAIYGAGERDWVFRLWESAVRKHALPNSPLWDCVGRLSVADADELAGKYHSYLRWLSPGARRVTDKTPANFLHLGLIAMLFPSARVIHCRRDPLDTCLSCYMTDFSTGSHFSFDLTWAGHFYRQNDRLMSHWKAALDLPILEVDYEHVVNDVEGQSRRMLQFLGMPWDDACLRFHESARFVPTASGIQVRRPIYTDSVGRWRHYQAHLAPLLEVLR